MKIRGVIFDMDGLMFDTERVSVLAHEAVGRELGLDLSRCFYDVMGMTAPEIERFYNERFGPDFHYAEIRVKLRAFSAAYFAEHGMPIKPGLLELVGYLREHGYEWIMATSTARYRAENNLRMAGVTADFPRMVCGDMVSRSKPDPEIFHTAASIIGCAPQETLVLEDSFNGIRAGAAGGFVTCMVPDLRQPTEELAALLTRKFDTLFDVIPFLEEQNA